MTRDEVGKCRAMPNHSTTAKASPIGPPSTMRNRSKEGAALKYRGTDDGLALKYRHQAAGIAGGQAGVEAGVRAGSATRQHPGRAKRAFEYLAAGLGDQMRRTSGPRSAARQNAAASVIMPGGTMGNSFVGGRTIKAIARKNRMPVAMTPTTICMRITRFATASCQESSRMKYSFELLMPGGARGTVPFSRRGCLLATQRCPRRENRDSPRCLVASRLPLYLIMRALKAAKLCRGKMAALLL